MIFNGSKLASKQLLETKKKIISYGLTPSLYIFQAKEDKKGQQYSRLIQKQADKIKIKTKIVEFVLDQKPLLKIKQLSREASAVLIQKPGQAARQKYFSSQKEFDIWWLTNTSRIPEKKDIDCLNPVNLGLLMAGLVQYFPATVKAIYRILREALRENKRSLNQARVCIIGASAIVGRPLSMLLRRDNANVVIVAEDSSPIPYTTMSDIIISAVGRPQFITAKMIKPGAVVIDAGFSIVKDKVVGDVDFNKVRDKASFITPVPGGVGPMTIASLLENVYLADKKNKI